MLALDLARSILTATPAEAWRGALAEAWRVCSAPLPAGDAIGEITTRDRALSAVDLALTTAAWDLWADFPTTAPHTADALAAWWSGRASGRAVLILDGLSLREVPWLLQGAAARRYTVHAAYPTVSELPGITETFAAALGFAGRASLANNGATRAHRFPGAHTESFNLPWSDAMSRITPDPDWVLWHHWPDVDLHEHAADGLEVLTREVAHKLTGEEFWSLVGRLCTGRRLVITADHGYAASGLHPDAGRDEARQLKEAFGGARYAEAASGPTGWLPPLALAVGPANRSTYAVLGRRKWRSQAGHPKLAHGGLTILEVAVPFLELSRSG